MDADHPVEPDVASLFAPVAVEETFGGVLTEARQVLGGLDEHPASVAGAVLGDRSVVAMVGGLAGGRHQAEVACGTVAVLEAGDLAEGCEQRLCHGAADAGESGQQADAFFAIAQVGEQRIKVCDFLLDGLQQAQVAVDHLAAVVIEIEVAESFDAAWTEQVGGGLGDEAFGEHGVQAVLDRRAIGDEGGSAAGKSVEALRGGIGFPDARQEVAAQELGEDQGIHLVGFDLGFGNGFGA